MVVQVRRELLLSFGGLALAASVMAGTAIWAQSRAADELNTFMQGLNRRGQTATALELAGRNRALEVRNALLAASDGDRAAALQRARGHHDEVQRQLKTFQDLTAEARDMGDDARALVRQIAELERAYAPVVLAVVELTEKGQREAAAERLNRDCLPLLQRLSEVMGRYAELARQREAELIERTEQQLARQRLLLLGLGAVVVLGALFTTQAFQLLLAHTQLL